jgi:alpha-tubulin suppressor-like RCC1 family protein
MTPAPPNRQNSRTGPARSARPRRAARLAAAAALVLGTLALAIDGSSATSEPPLAWGFNAEGQLGQPPGDPNPTPTPVAGLGGVLAVAAGHGHSLALMADFTVRAWGRRVEGQLGDGGPVGSTVAPSPAPVQVKNLTNVKAVAAGWYHSLALKADGTVWAWGANHCGQLGNGDVALANQRVSTPGQVVGLSGVVAIAAGRGHNLALSDPDGDGKGTLWAWGDATWGQLGNGNSNVGLSCGYPAGPRGEAKQFVPNKVLVAEEVVAFAAGSDHSLAITSDGQVWSWGNNCAGQLGSGQFPVSTARREIPGRVEGLPAGRVVSVASV